MIRKKKIEEINKKEKELQKIENDIFEMEIYEEEFQTKKLSFLQTMKSAD